MATPNPSTQLVKVEVQIPENERERLDEIAFELSEPGDVLDRSDVLRESIRDYIDKAEEAPGDCQPRSRGGLRPIEIEEQEGQ